MGRKIAGDGLPLDPCGAGKLSLTAMPMSISSHLIGLLCRKSFRSGDSVCESRA